MIYSITYFHTINKKEPDYIFGLSLGGIITFGTICFGPYNGACINIIRMFGPSIVTDLFKQNFIYIISNIFGTLFGCFYYK